jgi:N utilization substance protein B
MGSRRRAREFALQALYQQEVGGVEPNAAAAALWAALMEGEGLDDDGSAPESAEVEFTQRLLQGVHEHRERIDTLIDTSSTNWRIHRMPTIDRNILRLAGFEILECLDVPATVSINEAVELAKKYGAKDSRAFVNGLVDRMARRADRLPDRRKGG